jgi:hypothetical protein
MTDSASPPSWLLSFGVVSASVSGALAETFILTMSFKGSGVCSSTQHLSAGLALGMRKGLAQASLLAEEILGFFGGRGPILVSLVDEEGRLEDFRIKSTRHYRSCLWRTKRFID